MWLFLWSVTNFCLIISALDCTVEPDGVYELGCKSFQKCVHGELVGVECHEHLVYNSIIQDCDEHFQLLRNDFVFVQICPRDNYTFSFSPAKVAAPCGHMMDCTNKADGHYPDLDQGCHTYYTCNGGVFFGHNYCPAGLVFSVANGVCDWRQNVPIPCGLAIPTAAATTETSQVMTTASSTVTTASSKVTTESSTTSLQSTQPGLKTMSIILATINKQD
ncbi:hypothetical protein LOTGIDRAFT_163491 [Lottia gigantea]|uniref:Chitin-binding type-2 domain-containing protein n=1 Tax=Lottia gigantea TaxID=225164 RepID=V4A2R6_LOTGI|nr:hypothetical protein LOTGIDRAFT_163491 [Lottia gigantea]ESO90982.1 hypothetical protein LOTGIDRAFT_163491 [Lottia gigantea]